MKISGQAIVITGGFLDLTTAKTAHGLLRGTQRFEILAVIDAKFAGQDAGEVMEGKANGIQVFNSVEAYLSDEQNPLPQYCIVGVATHGGYLPSVLKEELLYAARKGMNLVSGLHYMLNEDADFQQVIGEGCTKIYDIRRVKPRHELRFWNGDVLKVKTPRIAVLGTDCALGKRTTCQFLTQMCNQEGIRAEMIYTGQTGWLQGHKYGFIFDSTVNDFISGEIERAIVDCDREATPDVMFIEGQSSLRNPAGPCGAEFLLSGNANYVVLQHSPFRTCFDDTSVKIPSIESEIALIKYYGAEVIALSLNEENASEEDLLEYQTTMKAKLNLPILRPLKGELVELLPLIKSLIHAPR